MGIEIERKFLVDHKLWQEADKPEGIPYRQGYLLNTPEKTVRVRVAGTKGYITIKGATEGFSRKEYEYEIPVADANELLGGFTEKRIEKTRFKVPYAGKLWEVDVFAGDNERLIVAEIELRSEDETPEFPHWIADEVTHDNRYYNSALSIHPYSEWDK
ncbi:CYTH domain-containing protein [Mucilaginibacter sp. Bleaf8]|uniref:CYTH domain-containing protein n=1 Tax=Mucilaginibacter sp. Bleaf8 TaxID=2834430 RepID=UPI001BCCAC76|nr:CYTH domain-containing protein [Mucilaginibacter sp. Bleaf8]MBS7564411.1 CYTH domain-containing protein [Mucilaginibacter sp. Bleaf8]